MLASLHYWLSLQMSSQNDFFLSHTQRDAEAKVIAQMLYSGMKDLGKTCWLDVMMQARDINAMKEGVINCKCLIAIITDNGKDSYFSRDMCRQVRHIFIAVACLFVFDDINVCFVVYVCRRYDGLLRQVNPLFLLVTSKTNNASVSSSMKRRRTISI